MKSSLLKNYLLLGLSAVLTLLSTTARAGHAQGGELTYEYIGTSLQPNLYRVSCRMVRDCSGIAAPSTLTLSCRVGTATSACNSNDSRNFTASLVRAQLTPGTPYCTAVGNACSPAGRPNFESARYEATVNLPPAPEWQLSVAENARPVTRNVPAPGDLYLTASLNNQLALAGGTMQVVQNTSARYHAQNAPLAFVCFNQRASISFSAAEAEGDSLVYSLERPLNGCNQPVTYGPVVYQPGFPTTCMPIIPGPATYSAHFPIFSYRLSGSCPVLLANPFFNFNSYQGTCTFQPLVYDSSIPANNQYVVMGRVTEYRKLGGRYYKVGSVTRDMLVVSADCGNNAVPRQPATTAGGPALDFALDSLVVEAPVIAFTNASFHFTDPNPADQLTISYVLPTDPLYESMYTNPAAPAAPVTVLGNGTATPVLQVRLRPDPSLLGFTYRIPVRVEDNACPLKAAQNYVLVLRATPQGAPTAAPAGRRATPLTAYPNPFTDEVSFTLPRAAAGQAVLILDPLGRVVQRLSVPAGPGSEATLRWTPASALPAGVYTARTLDGRFAARLLRQ